MKRLQVERLRDIEPMHELLWVEAALLYKACLIAILDNHSGITWSLKVQIDILASWGSS